MKDDPEQAEAKFALLSEINKELTSFEQAMASPERERRLATKCVSWTRVNGKKLGENFC